MTRRAIEDIGQQAARNGKPLPYSRKHQAAVDWLVNHDFASCTSRNKIVLLSSCMEAETQLSNPQLVELPDSNLSSDNSLFGLRKKLKQQGWSPATKESPADVEGRIFRVQSNVKAYFELLLTRDLNALEWARASG